MEEFKILKQVFEKKHTYSFGGKFRKYEKMYIHTNENLKAYITDLKGKTVLTVSASGDQLLNSLVAGANVVDTFDINRYSPLFQNLRLYSVKYLESDLALSFLNKLDKNIYFKFNKNLPVKEKQFFDYLFNNFDINYIYDTLFYLQTIDNKKINNYFNKEVLDYIRGRVDGVLLKHYSCNMYSLPNFMDKTYDAIYLSNISYYQKNMDKFLNFINYLKQNYLNEGGKIYYGYLYEQSISSSTYDIVNAIREINDNFFKELDEGRYRDIIENTEVISVECAETSKQNYVDRILVLKR